MNKTKIVNRIVSLVGLAFGAFALSALAGSWTAPTQAPPSGNADAPLNVGVTAQHKEGTLAIGKTSDALTGLKLDVNGIIGSTGLFTTGDLYVNGVSSTTQLKVTGGSPSIGKVLTSDASGNATWQSPPLSGSSIVMGRVQGSSAAITLNPGSWTVMVTAYFGECKLTPVVMKIDGVEIGGSGMGRDATDLGDEQGCDQNAVTGIATNLDNTRIHTVTLEKLTADPGDEFANSDPNRSQINKRQFWWIAVRQ
jgi:hypothetical protein